MQALIQRSAGDIRRNQEEPVLDLAKFKQGQNMIVLEVRADFSLAKKTRNLTDVNRYLLFHYDS